MALFACLAAALPALGPLHAFGAELIVDEGVVVKLGHEAQIVVRDSIDAREALFTSVKDDSAGGAAGQAPSTPQAGDWAGIKVEASAVPGDVVLTDVTLRYATTGLWLRKSAHQIEFLTARDCGTGVRASDGATAQLRGAVLLSNSFGLVSERAAPQLIEAQIAGSGAYGVFNHTPAIGAVFATGNWWGNASGPADPVGNPGGTGDLVSEGVAYAAWLAGIPLIDPQLALAAPGVSVDTRNIALELFCRNAVEYRLAENSNFGAAPFLPLTGTAGFTLSPGDGLKQVAVEYRASTGNTAIATLPGGILYDTLGPVVSLVSPEAGAVVTRPLAIEATALDPAGVTRVELYVDDQRVATATSAPYKHALPIDTLADGPHTIKAVAFDALGRTTSDSRGIVVRKPLTAGLTVDARATIYGAAQANLPDPFALPPVFVRFAPGVGKALTITAASGQVTNGGISNGADGSGINTDVGALGGLSAIRVTGRNMFLAGVFLTDNPPHTPPPPPLELGGNTGFALLGPAIGQVFFIGDGLTGSGTGQQQLFAVPPGATRLFLGFAESTAPGATASGYSDNSGALGASIAIEDNAIADLTGPSLSGVSYGGTPLGAGQMLARSATLTAAAVDPSGVSRVELFVDAVRIGSDSNGSDGYAASVDLFALTDGPHVLTLKAYDSVNNVTEIAVPVTIALAPPAAPAIGGPASGIATAQKRQTVTGTAEPGTLVQLYLNGAPSGGSATAGATGSYSIDATLAEGPNRLRTAASNRGGTSGLSNEVLVTIDSSIPAAPLNLSATAQAGGRVRLAWQRGSDTAAKGYHVYRATQPFVEPAQAARVNAELVAGLSYDDLPPADGVYYYRAIAVNALGTASAPSAQASAGADSTAPRAVAIEYRPTGPYDSASGRFGRGRVEVTLRLSEAAAAAPFLSIAPTGGGPIALALTAATDTEYRGSFDIGESTPSGNAYAVFSARDAVGNRGTEIGAGASLLIDAAGPAVTALNVTPSEPIRNDASTPAEVTVAFTLSEAMKPGATPQLGYLLSGSGRSLAPIGGIAQTGPASYRATFVLPADGGGTQIEELSFAYAGVDDLDNVSTRILANNRFQVYQGELPPGGVPTGLAARPLPGGKVELAWNVAQDAAAYQLYRQAPGEIELSPYQRLLDPGYLDAAASDGVHRYAVASIRAHNGQESLSARSAIVDALADATPPDAPRELLLGLTGAGIAALWKAPAASDVTGFNIYRSSAPAITSVAGLAPLRSKVQALSFVDAAPSADEHSYVVTALDAAGNESPISNSAYLNAALLPVNNLEVVQNGDALPVLSWTHPTGALAGYDVYVGPDSARIKLTPSLLGTQSFTDTGYTGEERRYSVAAVDSHGLEIARTITLPRLQVKAIGGFPVQRGVFNRLDYQLTNLGSAPVPNARLKVLLGTRTHLSQPFFLNAGETKVVPVVVGGYPDLEAPTPLTATIEITPNEGERVEIVRTADAQIADGSLTLSVQPESLTRGNTGKVRFTLSNVSAVETQIVTARALGQLPSDQIRVRLIDRDGNVLVSQPFFQVDGGVETYSSGVTVARLAPGASFTSAPLDLPVPSAASDEISVLLDIDRLHYRIGEPEQASLPGLSSGLSARLHDNAYYAQVTGIDPQISYGDSAIVVRGRTLESRGAQPLASVPVKLILAVDGFERVLDLFSDASGSFVHTFVPQRSDAGRFVVSAIHPSSFERPDQGHFLISRVGASPTQVTLRALRNIAQTVGVAVAAGPGSGATNLRLLVDPADQPTGALPRGVRIDAPASLSLAAGERRTLAFSVTGDNTSADTGALVLRLVYDERGADPLALIRIDYRFYNADSTAPDVFASLYPTPTYVETSAARDSAVTEQVALENKGLGAAKDVKVALIQADGTPAPAWIALANQPELGTLEPGQRKTVDVSIAPNASTAEGIYSFKLRVTGANIPKGDVNLFVSVTQAGTGNLLFKASDFYTATLDRDGRVVPGLAGAAVSIQNERVPDQRFTLTTDALGEAYFSDVPAGRYRFRATAPNHQEATGSIVVKPGLTVAQDLFLNNALVSVQWAVRETTVVDRYEITLALTFETNVPAPVVVIEPTVTNLPKLDAGNIYYGELTLTNYGLVRAENIAPVLPSSDAFLRYEFLSAIPASLEAKQRITIPYRIVALKSLEPDGASSGGGCFDYLARLFVPYDFECANGSRSVGGTESRWSYAAGGDCPGFLLGGFNAGGSTGGGGTGGIGVGGSATVGSTGGGSVGRSTLGGGFVDYVPAYDSLPGGKCVPGCSGKCCSAGGVPAGGGGGCGGWCPVPRDQ